MRVRKTKQTGHVRIDQSQTKSGYVAQLFYLIRYLCAKGKTTKPRINMEKHLSFLR